MTQRDAAFLGCRLMSAYIAISATLNLPFALAHEVFSRENPTYATAAKTLAGKFIDHSITFNLCFQLVLATVLFYGAGFFSGWLSNRPDEEAKTPSPRSLFTVGAALIGLYLAAGFAPTLLGNLYAYVTNAVVDRQPDGATITANIVGTILSALFVALAILWSRRDRSTDRQDPD